MMDLSTTYLGLPLRNPFVAGPSPLTGQVDTVERLVEAGISAVVFPPLFEEQLTAEQLEVFEATETPAHSFAEALSYFAVQEAPLADAGAHVARLAEVKRRTSVPVIGAINAVTAERWTEYARRMEDAGADGVELDFYFVALDPAESGEEIEGRFADVLARVKASVRIPVGARLTASHTSLPHFARRLEAAGADGLVLLHRPYGPDLDVENLEPVSRLLLSDSRELPERLRWLAVLSGSVACSLAASGGVHTVEDAVKAVMTGAHCVHLSSVLLAKGPEHAKTLREGLAAWLGGNGYESLGQLRGSMNIERIPDPRALSRLHYMHLLNSWGSR